jgi:hypothetical protein
MSLIKIYSIAKKVRKQCEKFANSKEAKGKDFYKYKNLACMCAVASHALLIALKDKGIEAVMVRGKYQKHSECYPEHHCWVEYKDNVIDITATQFEVSKRVYIVKNDIPNYRRMRRIKAEAPNPLKSWGCRQGPSHNLSKKILSIPV